MGVAQTVQWRERKGVLPIVAMIRAYSVELFHVHEHVDDACHENFANEVAGGSWRDSLYYLQ